MAHPTRPFPQLGHALAPGAIAAIRNHVEAERNDVVDASQATAVFTAEWSLKSAIASAGRG